MRRRQWLTAAAAAPLAGVAWQGARAAEPIVLGAVHALSGPLAVSEWVFAEALQMAVDEVNEQGGVLGRPLQLELRNSDSNDALASAHAETLFSGQQAAAVFGGWASETRQAITAQAEAVNGLYFYPGTNEDAVFSQHAVYGSAPLPLMMPFAVRYLLRNYGGLSVRWVLLGMESGFSAAMHDQLRASLAARGVPPEAIMERRVPYGFDAFDELVVQSVQHGHNARPVVISSLEGVAALRWFRALSGAGLSAQDLPVFGVGLSEEELRMHDPSLVMGHMALWSYFHTLGGASAERFRQRWAMHARRRRLPGHTERPLTTDPMEASYLAVWLWAKAATRAGSIAAPAVRAALPGVALTAPSGATVRMSRINHCLQRPLMVGRARRDGLFDVVARSDD